MTKQINNIKKTREYLLKQIEELSVEQLNKVPQGFNNNIIWNLGHLVAAQQGVCYIRAGLKPALDEKLIAPYRPGTKPEGIVESDDIAIVKELLLSSLNKLEADYQNKEFEQYTTWSTRYGVELSSIEDAIEFLMFHEGLHGGVIMALKKIV